jgi:hypothetical protein
MGVSWVNYFYWRMHMSRPTLIQVLSMAMVLFMGQTCTGKRYGGLSRLSTEADAVIVVEILSTDYSATAADGPMYAETKVLKVLTGDVSTGSELRFAESGWWEPSYKKGERRVLFLARTDAEKQYFKAKWHTVYTDGVDFFVAPGSLDDLSAESLLGFLTKTEQLSSTTPRIEFLMTRSGSATRVLSVRITNDGHAAFWLNMSRITVSFEANRIRHYPEVSWADCERDTWQQIQPGLDVAGSIDIKGVDVKQERQIELLLSHSSVCFPHDCWIGVASTNIILEETRGSEYHESLAPIALSEWTDSPDGRLSLCFAVDKTTSSRNEAFSIRCAIRNNSDKALTILRPFGDEFYSLSSGLYILGPAGPITYRGAWKDYVLGIASFHELPPHTIIDETLDVPDELFPGIQTPGLYKMVYTYQSSNYPRKASPENHWKGEIMSGSAVLLRQ